MSDIVEKGVDLPPALVAEISRIAESENRSASQVVADAVDMYVKRRELRAEVQGLAAEGRAHTERLGLKPNSDAQASRIVDKAIAESREARGK